MKVLKSHCTEYVCYEDELDYKTDYEIRKKLGWKLLKVCELDSENKMCKWIKRERFSKEDESSINLNYILSIKNDELSEKKTMTEFDYHYSFADSRNQD